MKQSGNNMKFSEIFNIMTSDHTLSVNSHWNDDKKRYTSTFTGERWIASAIYTAGAVDWVGFISIYDELRCNHYYMVADDMIDPPTVPDTMVELELEDDFMEKMECIIAGAYYDKRIMIPLDFSDSEFNTVARAAHELNMTLNDFIEHAITEQMRQNALESSQCDLN